MLFFHDSQINIKSLIIIRDMNVKFSLPTLCLNIYSLSHKEYVQGGAPDADKLVQTSDGHHHLFKMFQNCKNVLHFLNVSFFFNVSKCFKIVKFFHKLMLGKLAWNLLVSFFFSRLNQSVTFIQHDAIYLIHRSISSHWWLATIWRSSFQCWHYV